MSSNRIHELREHLRTPLYKNAYALIINTGLTSLFGIVYWFVAAHVASSANVGHVTALISAMMLISTVTQLNMVSVFIRFLPRAGSQTKRLVIRGYTITVALAVVIALLIVGLATAFGSSQNLLHMSKGMTIAFVLSTAVWTLFSLQDSVLTGLRKSVVVPVENAVYGLIKIIALFLFVPLLGESSGIFASTNIPTFLVVLPISWLIFSRYIPVHTKITEDEEQPIEIRKVLRYIAGDYMAGLFAQASTTLLPILVIGVLGKESAAYFYFAQIIGTTLDRVSLSFSSSLTVEAATQTSRINEYARSVLKKGLILVGSCAIFIFIFAPWILRIFGADYAQHATGLLRLLALASIPRVVSMVYGSMARLWHKTYQIAIITFTQAVILGGGSIPLMKHYGLAGVGIAAVAAQLVIVVFVFPILWKATAPTAPPSIPATPPIQSMANNDESISAN